MISSLGASFIKPALLYGLQPLLAVIAALFLLGGFLFWRRRRVQGVLCLLLLAAAAATIPLYHDTVLRARDAAPQVVRLWGQAYPGAFALDAEGRPGLPHFTRAVRARIGASLPGGRDLFGWADDCLRYYEGRGNGKRRYELHRLERADSPAPCRTAAGLSATYGIDWRDILQAEYNRFQRYALGVIARDRRAQDHCPSFYSLRGEHQKQILDANTGLMKPEHDLSANSCACVALNRHEGCRALSARDENEGYAAQLRDFAFYTPLTCDLSELCTALRGAGVETGLLDETPAIPAAEKPARVAAARARCIAAEQFKPAQRAYYCTCASTMLVGQDPRLSRLSRAALSCWEQQGWLDDSRCVIGEADWRIAAQAVFTCTMEMQTSPPSPTTPLAP